MRRGNRQMQQCRRKNNHRGVEVCRKAADRLQLEDLSSDGLDDAPAAKSGAECHRGRAEQLHIERHLKLRKKAARNQRQRNDTHGLLRIIRSVGKGHGRSRQDLHALEPAVDDVGIGFAKGDEQHIHHNAARDDRNNGRCNERYDNLADAVEIQPRAAHRHQHRTDQSTDQCMGRTGRHRQPPSDDIPNDRADKRRNDDFLVHQLRRAHDVAADGFGYAGAVHGPDKV